MDADHAFIVLCRLAERKAQKKDLIVAALQGRESRCAAAAIDAAARAGDPIGLCLADVLAKLGDGTLALRLQPRLPTYSVALNEAAIEIDRQCLRALGGRDDDEEEEALRRAGIWNDLANRLAMAGQRDAALDAATAAVNTYRTQAEASGVRLAGALVTLARMQGDAGATDEALASIREAVALHRGRLTETPAAFAAALTNLGSLLLDRGDFPGSIAAVEEALHLLDEADGRREPVDWNTLAAALANRAGALNGLGRHREAAAAGAQAVRFRRWLEGDRPDAFRPGLASVLATHAVHLFQAGQRSAALEAATEAIALYRDLAAARPEGFGTPHAQAALNAAAMLCEAGRPQEALALIGNAIEAFRVLASRNERVFGRRLGMAFYNQVLILLDLGRPSDAIDIAREAVKRLHPGPSLHSAPARVKADLAAAMCGLANALRGGGHATGSRPVLDAAVRLFRDTEDRHGAAGTSRLVAALTSLSQLCAELADVDAALATAREAAAKAMALEHQDPVAHGSLAAATQLTLAVRLGRGHAVEAAEAARRAVGRFFRLDRLHPGHFRREKAHALDTLGIALGRLGRKEAALAVARAALGLRRALFQDAPETGAVPLAMSLNNVGAAYEELHRHAEALDAYADAMALLSPRLESNPVAVAPLLDSVRTNHRAAEDRLRAGG